MSKQTIIKAIRAMCDTNGKFESKGKNRVLVAQLPHDEDTSQFIVGGHPVFTVSFDGPAKKACFTTCGFAGASLSKEEYQLSAAATNLMFELLEIEATAKGRETRMDISSEDELFVTYGSIQNKFDLDTFYAKLDALEMTEGKKNEATGTKKKAAP